MSAGCSPLAGCPLIEPAPCSGLWTVSQPDIMRDVVSQMLVRAGAEVFWALSASSKGATADRSVGALPLFPIASWC